MIKDSIYFIVIFLIPYVGIVLISKYGCLPDWANKLMFGYFLFLFLTAIGIYGEQICKKWWD